MFLRWKVIIERRSRTLSWVYVLCAIIALFLALLAIGMEGDLWALVPEVPILALCIVQLVRPTLLAWFLLLLIFGTYTIGVLLVNDHLAGNDLPVFLLVSALPTLALLFAFPRITTSESDRGG